MLTSTRFIQFWSPGRSTARSRSMPMGRSCTRRRRHSPGRTRHYTANDGQADSNVATVQITVHNTIGIILLDQSERAR